MTKLIIGLTGGISGAAIQLNWMAGQSAATEYEMTEVVVRLILGAAVTAVLFWSVHRLVMKLAVMGLPAERRRRLSRWSACSFLPALATVLGFWGIVMTAELIAAIVAAMIAINLVGQMRCDSVLSPLKDRVGLGLLFLISGFAALIYQVVWQRVLFTTFGINMESVALVVSVFMFGLGIGAFVGGQLCRRFPEQLRELFFVCEAVIGIFGLVSISIIRFASDVVVHGSMPEIGLTVFAILCLPTMMMGATLPVLVTHINRNRKNLGDSVGWMYFFNTIGSALAALLTVTVIFPAVGLQYAVWIAAALNFLVAGLVLAMTQSEPGASLKTAIETS